MFAAQIFADGPKYFKDEWNLMDGSIVVTSVTADVLGLLSVEGSALSSLRVLRALRALRPLRLIPRAPGLKRVVNAMIRGLPPVLNVAVVVLVFFLIFRSVVLLFYLKTDVALNQRKFRVQRRCNCACKLEVRNGIQKEEVNINNRRPHQVGAMHQE